MNAKSSTEAEIIGASDYLPWTIWVKWFLKDQGYILKRSIFYEDNQSAMKMESNGMRSAGDKSRHMNIRYFFIKDVLQRESIELSHCPTERMIADFYTKPLQGSLFRKMRHIVMRLVPFPDKEHLRLKENMSIEVSVKCASTGISGTEILNLGANTGLKPDGRRNKIVSYEDVVRGDNLW